MTSSDRDTGSVPSRIASVPTRHGDTLHGSSDRPAASAGPRPSGAGLDQRDRTSASIDVPGSGNRTKDARRGAKTKDRTTQRATQACLKCRRQKLRCLGGNPCERCIRTSSDCDFGQTGGRAAQDSGDADSTETVAAPPRRETPVAMHDQGRDERLKLLEDSVANLLAGLADEPDLAGQGYPHLEIFHEVVRHRTEPIRSTPSLQSITTTRLPPPTHVRPLDPIRFGTGAINSLVSPSSTHQGPQSISPATIFEASSNEPSYSAPHSLEPISNRGGSNAEREGEIPFPATESLYEAPFRSLVRPVSCKRPR